MHGRVGNRVLRGAALTLVLFVGWIGQSAAVPSFARQTGQECPACHVSWPELTPYGRYFKLTGYTIGKTFISSEGFNYVPMAVMAQASVTHIRNNNVTDPDTGDTVGESSARTASCALRRQACSLRRKVNDYIGGFIQWTYDNLATTADGTLGGHSSIDNTDIRAAVQVFAGRRPAIPEWIFGMTLNNNPTVQDPWNSTPAWGYPYTGLAARDHAGRRDDHRRRAGAAGGRTWRLCVLAEDGLHGVLGLPHRQRRGQRVPRGAAIQRAGRRARDHQLQSVLASGLYPRMGRRIR